MKFSDWILGTGIGEMMQKRVTVDGEKVKPGAFLLVGIRKDHITSDQNQLTKDYLEKWPLKQCMFMCTSDWITSEPMGTLSFGLVRAL